METRENDDFEERQTQDHKQACPYCGLPKYYENPKCDEHPA